MKIAIVYKSLTGNTKTIAEAIAQALKSQEVVYVGEPTNEIEAEFYFVGSWTDKGNCDVAIGEFLQTLSGKQIAYFGTAGFGGSQEYYDALSSRVKAQIPKTNTVLGTFFCQGKMPMSVRDRYVSMLQTNPEDEKLKVSIDNFDAALSHPDENDIKAVIAWGESVIRKIMD